MKREDEEKGRILEEKEKEIKNLRELVENKEAKEEENAEDVNINQRNLSATFQNDRETKSSRLSVDAPKWNWITPDKMPVKGQKIWFQVKKEPREGRITNIEKDKRIHVQEIKGEKETYKLDPAKNIWSFEKHLSITSDSSGDFNGYLPSSTPEEVKTDDKNNKSVSERVVSILKKTGV